ncbi:MAG: MBL fold metallo-hydrolase [Promethearchaeota archaeon]|nr:MAG: MBL fold metallo-hydrolase [Candidatus Lokiarchaeota archaeon]
MLKAEIILLSNNVCLPFQKLNKEFEFIEFNKLFATKSLAEHGIGFLINIYDLVNLDDEWNVPLLKKIIFDTGGPNFTFLHNLDIRGYNLHDVNHIVLSHYHYDHTGSLYKILERMDDAVQVICHTDAKYERFFRRSDDVKDSDLKGKTREQISHLLAESKIVNQVPIDLDKIEKLKGKIFFSRTSYELLNQKGLKIIVSGEIPRKHEIEDFSSFFSLQEGILKVDKIKDDKCLILEFDNHSILLLGCCHSGLMNTLDYVKGITDKPISHIIGGFHMASASEEQISATIEYLRSFQNYDKPLYLFPIHCTGNKFIQHVNRIKFPEIKAFDCSVGTVFNFNTSF